MTRGSLAEWSKALVLGTSPKGRGFESHSCQNYITIFFKSQYANKSFELAELANASAFCQFVMAKTPLSGHILAKSRGISLSLFTCSKWFGSNCFWEVNWLDGLGV